MTREKIKYYIECHLAGILRLEEQHDGDVYIENEQTKKLILDIKQLCVKSNLSYVEIQKALIVADESLMATAKP